MKFNFGNPEILRIILVLFFITNVKRIGIEVKSCAIMYSGFSLFIKLNNLVFWAYE